MRRCYGLLPALLVCAAANAADVQALIGGITNPSPDVRAEAWKGAGPAGAEAVAPLAEQLTASDPEVAKAAATALDTIVDFACRPGTTEGKAAVAAELGKLLDASKPVPVRSGAVRLLALCGGEAEASAVAALLSDSDATLAEDARETLEEMPGAAVTQALAGALPKLQPPLAEAVAASLGRRGDAAAIPALKDFAATSTATAKCAALAALARLGVPPADVMPRPESGDARVCWDEARLGAAAALAASHDDRALQLYCDAVWESGEARQVLAGLIGFMKPSFKMLSVKPGEVPVAVGFTPAPSAFVPLAIETLKHEGTRHIVIPLLVKGIDAQGDALLANAFSTGSPAVQTAILEVLALRKSPELGAVVSAAKGAEAPEVRLAAMEAAGEKPATELLLETVEKGTPWAQRHAVELVLASAVEAEGTDPASAQALYERLVRSSAAPVLKREAFAGLERMARAESLPLLDELVKPFFDNAAPVTVDAEALRKAGEQDSGLLAAAQRAYVAAHAAQGKELALPVLTAVLVSMPAYNVSTLAAEKIAELGVDPQAVSRSAGFITNWQVLGPFPNDDGTAFEKAIVPEGDAALPESVADVKRVDAQAQGLPAILDLRGMFRSATPVVAYAYAEINSAAEKTVQFRIGSNDGCAFWVNGTKLESINKVRALEVDGDKVEATLRPGANRVLIKVMQDSGEWAFCVRVTDPAGTPLDLNQ